ncbi:MAG: flagellar basal-body rod protein FlgF [Lachnospiraceae bacterium]|nr:flagellar basal-body rod protein FlgF [Lachnospiraceae bacterium]
MVKGLYTAYTGMIHQQKRLDVISNNLANSATVGFKREGATARAFNDELAIKIKDASEGFVDRGIGDMSMGVKFGETYRDYTQGSLRVTDNDYDLALSGEGFFQISFTSKSGETVTRLTRDGNFTVNTLGYLVTQDGDFVLGTDGNPIRIDPNEKTTIDAAGRILQNDTVVANLSIVDVEDYNYLQKYGENLFDLVEGGTLTASSAAVEQGCLEQSNVQVVKEMVEMINVTRAYETNQKAIQAVDETLDKAVNQVGRV